MKIKFLVVLLSCFCWLNSQALDTLNYIYYHKEIAKAEEFLSKEKFKESLNIYKACFKKYKFNFAKDLYHATQVSSILKSQKDFDSLFIRCATSGVSYKLLCKTQLINLYIKKDSIKYSKLYSVYYQVYKKKINLKLRKEFQSRFVEEQRAKFLPVKDYRTVVFSNYKRIKQLIDSGLFPSERNIGLDFGKILVLDLDMDISSNFTFSTLLHYPYSYSSLKAELYNALKNGDITPGQFAYVYSFEKMQIGVLYPPKKKDSLNYMIYYNIIPPYSNLKDSVNMNRAKIGLCTLESEELRNKITKKYNFLFRGQ